MARGSGGVFQPTRDGQKLGNWYAWLSVNGRQVRRTGFATRRKAEDWLKAERKRRARGETVSPDSDRLRVSDLLDSYIQSLRDRGKKAIHSAKLRADTVAAELGSLRAVEVNVAHLEDYRKRRANSAGDITIDRDLQLLRAAFRLALRQERISHVPHFPISGRDNVRQGFFEPAEAEAVEKQLQGVLAEIFRFARFSGWRIGEVLSLRWEWIDRDAREVRLPTSKNGCPRVLYLFGELWKVIEARWSARTFRTKKTDANLSAFVFHRQGGRPLSYSRFRTDVAEASTAAGVHGRHIHDLRRSAARELRRAGVPESVCMAVTGHKTASMFRRYAITDSTDQARALEAREALLAAEAVKSGASDEVRAELVNFSSTSAAPRAAIPSKPL